MGSGEGHLLLSGRPAAESGHHPDRPLWLRASAYARIAVEPFDYGTEEITLPDIPQANPSAQDLKRDARDRALLAKIWNRKEGPARFTLPLGPPARPLPKGKSFGVKRVFNGKPAAQPHTGTDYPTPVGTPVLAVADGTVMVAEDLFFEGNAVFIDHGDGLISMYFHLSDIKVEAGQEVKKVHTLGRVGSHWPRHSTASILRRPLAQRPH